MFPVMKGKNRLTGEITDSFMFSRMFSSSCVVPFNAQPVASGALDAAYVAYSAQLAIKGPALAHKRVIHLTQEQNLTWS